MIYVTRLNHEPIILNCELIEHVETTPDTVISLTTGQKLMVLESAETVTERVLRYRRFIHTGSELEYRRGEPAEKAVLESGQHGQR